MRFALNNVRGLAACGRRSLLSPLMGTMRSDCGSVLTTSIKAVVIVLLVLVVAIVLLSLGDERAAGRFVSHMSGSDAAAPVGLRVLPWLN